MDWQSIVVPVAVAVEDAGAKAIWDPERIRRIVDEMDPLEAGVNWLRWKITSYTVLGNRGSATRLSTTLPTAIFPSRDWLPLSA